MSSIEEVYQEAEHPTIDSIDALIAYLHTPEKSARLAERAAYHIRKTLCSCLGETANNYPLDTVIPLDAETFQRHYNPQVPTIAIDARFSFVGTELIALANSQEAEPPFNIIFFATAANSAQIVQHNAGTNLELTQGIMILRDGQVAQGNLPQPVLADALLSGDADFIKNCHELGLENLVPLENVEAFGDKARLPQLITNPNVLIPQRFSREELAALPPESVVIKPAKHSQGRGIMIGSSSTAPAQMMRAYDFLEKHGYEPLVEQRIKSWPFIDPETKKRLDWNVRAIVSDGQLIDMYIRASDWGQPVNKSVGAQAISLEDIGKYMPDIETSCRILCTLLDGVAAVATEPTVGIAGIDLTVNEEGQPCVFEVNVRNFGGLGTIAQQEETLDRKLHAARRMLGLWSHNIPLTQRPTEIYNVKPLQASFDELVLSCKDLANATPILSLPFEAIPWDNTDHIGPVHWALLAEKAARKNQPERSQAMAQYLVANFPIELQDYLPSIVVDSTPPEEFVQLIYIGEQTFPTDPVWPTLRAMLAVQQLDLATMRTIANKPIIKNTPRNQFFPIMGVMFTEHFDLSDEELIAMPHIAQLLSDIPELYCNEDAAQTRKAVETALQAAQSEEDKELLYSILFLVEVSYENYDRALELHQYIRAEDLDDATILSFAFDSPTVHHQTIEGAKFLSTLAFRYGICLHPLFAGLDLAADYSDKPDEYRKLMRHLANTMPVEASRRHRGWFARLLTQLVVSDKADPMPAYPDKHTSDLTLLGTILWKLTHQDMVDFYDLIQRLSDRISDDDKDFLTGAGAHFETTLEK